MVFVIASMSRRRTGIRVPKLNCPQIPHIRVRCRASSRLDSRVRTYGLIRLQSEVIDALKFEKAFDDCMEFRQLFLAVEGDEFPRNRSRHAAYKCPAIAQSQSQASDNQRLLRTPVCNSEQFPDRMSTEVVIFLSIRKHSGKGIPFGHSQVPVVQKPFLSKGPSLPTHHASGRDCYPINPSSLSWDESANLLEAPSSKQLATTRNMVMPFETICFRTVPFLSEGCSDHTELRIP